LELRDAKSDSDEGARFISHFAKPSGNTGDSIPDLLWTFTTDKDGSLSIKCEAAQMSEYETFIRHVLDGVEVQAEMLRKPKGTISKWATRATSEGRISKKRGLSLARIEASMQASKPC
jgi:hypothetical protein